MQVAALGCTLAIAIIGGAISAFIASKIGGLEYQFDDTVHFEDVEYADAISRYSEKARFAHEKSNSLKE